MRSSNLPHPPGIRQVFLSSLDLSEETLDWAQRREDRYEEMGN